MVGMVGAVGVAVDGTMAEPRDRGDIVLGWLTRLVVALAVVAVIGFDAVQVGLANVQLQDQANAAAAAARDAYAEHHDVTQALAAAEVSAHGANSGDAVVPGSLSVARDGTVSLRLTRQIHTVLAHHLPVAAFTRATSGGSASPSAG